MREDRSTILVTGANGFIGSALIAYLRKSHHWNVIPCVRPGSEGKGEASYDLLDINSVPPLNGVDVVVHTAARVHMRPERNADPLSAFRAANVEGTLGLAKAAAKAGVRRFVFLSSIKVNGESTIDGRPFTPDNEPAPQDPYGISKFEAERELQALANASGMELVIIRPPLVYGPGAGGNIARITKAIRWMLPMPFRNVQNRRSIVDVRNLTDFIDVCASHKLAAGEVFLVGDATAYSTPELIKAVALTIKRKPILINMPLFLIKLISRKRSAVMTRLIGNLEVTITKNQMLLGWEPKYSIKKPYHRGKAIASNGK
ncbi:NAD-dependent epimerase/dehydratase family protein [Pseudomonas typographi]|uniref:NAD-dependent epimerase/dehydratase family protein n=1 Tax=Pseudomonas typographi TaxID=2715964 RepID=UPI00168464CA|nr:NAD-dependent epimerase/dehydratase family protein [Pseudomonas typographi]MBD1555169.1 NAD-dependent epimerase/dehydratase family protein [Pseudomonas typographi]MBD1589970.1 NAD-dependent epimerase/dehydratase family protein [Pseudomonas typographi]